MPFIEIVEEEETFRLNIGESYFDLRRFDSEKYSEVIKAHTRKHKNYKTGLMVTEPPDENIINADLLDYMIVGWGNIKSPTTKKDVPCERAIKLKLPGKIKLQIIEACDSEAITVEKKTNLTSSADE